MPPGRSWRPWSHMCKCGDATRINIGLCEARVIPSLSENHVPKNISNYGQGDPASSCRPARRAACRFGLVVPAYVTPSVSNRDRSPLSSSRTRAFCSIVRKTRSPSEIF